jgi:unsaturated rhamnogalacturonyl hydrolase
MDEAWDWPCGVAFLGLSDALEATGDEKIARFLQERIGEFIELGLPPWNVNTCAMTHCLFALHALTGEKAYEEILLAAIGYLKTKALRFGEGTLQHTVSSKNDFPEQAWADTLMMAALPMLKAGVKYGDEALINDSLAQFASHIEYLQDRATGLWYHGYDNIDHSHMSGFHWGRANAWAAVTMSSVSKVLPQPYLYPDFLNVSCSLRDQLSGLKLLQTENGLWRTVLDDPDSYEELSATAGIACAMIRNGNPLHTKYAKKALDGVLANISEDGSLLNVSGGTAVMRDLDGYRKVPKTWIQGWGQGLALSLLSEALRSCGG